MGANSHIEWTEATWNPVTGCTKVSAGCKNCYAERLALRLRAMGNHRYRRGFRVTLHEDILDLPRTLKTPRRIFVNSMSDLFHPDVPLWFIRRVFQTMVECPQHTFQVLTKRSDRVRKLSANFPWPRNVWMGVSVEDSRVLDRINDLRAVPAAVRFLSCEPLIGSLAKMDLRGVHWVIVGGSQERNRTAAGTARRSLIRSSTRLSSTLTPIQTFRGHGKPLVPSRRSSAW